MNRDNSSFGQPLYRLKILLSLGILATALIFGLSACSGDDTAANTTCSVDTDCDLGYVCSASNACIEASCEHCTEGQICYISDANPEGTCSAPECQIAEDCENDEPCIGGVCGGQSGGNGDDGCSSSSDCPDGEVCNLMDQCVPGGGSGDSCNDHTDCDTGTEFCDPQTEQCTPAVDCATVDCGPGEVCVEPYGTCQFDCNIDTSGCDEGQYCHEPTGECRVNNCPDLEPSDCTGATSLFDDEACECVACFGSTDCPAGQSCNNGLCEDSQGGGCETPCTSNDPGVCGATANTPYCIDNCCVECLGAADCSGNDICIDGFCGTTPDCSQDPSVCPSGFNCVGGECQPADAGASCSDPADCPDGQFCDATTQTCQSLGGGSSTGACGFCNDDCTCDNGLTCDPMVGACTGCDITINMDLTTSDNCPDGQSCDILTLLFGFPICLPD